MELSAAFVARSQGKQTKQATSTQPRTVSPNLLLFSNRRTGPAPEKKIIPGGVKQHIVKTNYQNASHHNLHQKAMF